MNDLMDGLNDSGRVLNGDEFIIRRAVAADADIIYGCMISVYNSLDDKSIFVCENIEYVRRNITEHGFAVVAETDSGRMAGAFVFEYPGQEINNLGRDIGLLESELDKVVHMDTVVVLPEYRGYGLQERMLVFAENMINKDKYRYYMATAAPCNAPSVNTFIKCGYRIVKVTEKYKGLTRAILRKDIGAVPKMSCLA